MSADTDRRELERIDRDILACEKKIADCDKKIATAESRANDAQKAISRTKSASTISSKMRQIEGYNRDKQRAMDDKTREQTKLTGLRKKRIDAQTKLQKSEAAEAKKAAEATKKSQDRMRAAYEGQIAALNSEIQALKATPVIPAGQPDHIYAPTGTEEYDVFISHATEDKATFVDEFVRILKSIAGKAGYSSICAIGQERIRRAGERIKGKSGLLAQNLDVGFRVFTIDESNMKDVFYGAGEYSQTMLATMETNIKEDRTDLDLLFGCLLEWGLPLSLAYRSEKIGESTVHTYNDGDLIACFDDNVPEDVIKKIAALHPLRAVFRDSSFASSPERINVEEIFKLLSPNTSVKVL